MSSLTHCDGPDCDVTATPYEAEIEIANMHGDVVYGWLTLTAGGHEFHFHNWMCLMEFAQVQVGRSAPDTPASHTRGTSSASGGV